MALAATESGVSWQGATPYSPLLALDAGGSWGATIAEPGPEPTYAPTPAGMASATWVGAQPYQPLAAGAADGYWQSGTSGDADPVAYVPLAGSAADASWQGARAYVPVAAADAFAQFTRPLPPLQSYQPLPALAVDASWQGAQPYLPLALGSADAQWQTAAPAEPAGFVASGFTATAFGTPERWVQPVAKQVRAQGWQSAGFGQPFMPQQAAPITAGVQFGFPRATFNTEVGGGAEPAVVQARGWRTGGFGRPAAEAALAVQAQGWQAPRFGEPVMRLTVHAAAIAPATAFGAPQAQLHLLAQARGWQSAQMGVAMTVRQGNAQGFSTTQFGTPTSEAAFGALAQGFRASSWGTPAMARVVHALPMSPSTRFGRPIRTWSTEC